MIPKINLPDITESKFNDSSLIDSFEREKEVALDSIQDILKSLSNSIKDRLYTQPTLLIHKWTKEREPTNRFILISPKSGSPLNSLNPFKNRKTEEEPKPKKQTSKILNDDQILAYNRRKVDDLLVAEKLKRALEHANQDFYLDSGENSNIDPNILLSRPMPKFALHHSATFFSGRVGLSYAKGYRPSMEDAHLSLNLSVDMNGQIHKIPLFAVFDGHGSLFRGDLCAEYLKEQLPIFLEKNLPLALRNENQEAAIYNLLKTAFIEIGDEYRKKYRDFPAGSTATLAMIFKNDIWVANCGDTRAIIASEDGVIALTEDAKPDREKYERGIIKRGGRVVFLGVPRVQKNLADALAIARSVGHDEIKEAINPRSTITKLSIKSLSGQKNYLVIACDGLWDVFSSRQIAKIIQQKVLENRSCEDMAKDLVQLAFFAGSTDNISVMIIPLDHFTSN